MHSGFATSKPSLDSIVSAWVFQPSAKRNAISWFFIKFLTRGGDLAFLVRNSHGIFCDDSALVEGGVLGSDDFSPAGGARAEEKKRSECEEKAEHFLMMDFGCWILGWGMGKRMLDYEFWILDSG